ncbi:AraC family transcriptional regulator [Novosphingobium sp. PASSN1]|uniref:AraC family transcriptional regulator n=1 Tax=Novosphingobium sp. PASSN1 TaxID=2015561 RepID=UPI000BC9532C|nr:AraC family transcriptional regulator [Novosphingobium sp. PASSN1]OYU36885.1 MAG: hypothetical protein CFE35_00340 [Novosphingobium sp. PASSN1]
MLKPTISVLVLRHVVNCLDLVACDPEPLLARFALRRDDLDNACAVMPLEAFLTFLECAAQEARNPYLGLQAGRLGALNSLGALGFLFLSAPSLRTALSGFAAYLATFQDAVRNRFTVAEGLGTYEYLITDQTLQSRRQDAEFSIALMHNMCRNYVGGDFELVEVRFEHACQSDERVYREFFRCPVFFDQETNAFSFETRFLDCTSPVIDPELYPIVEEHLRRRAAETARRGTSLEALVRALEASPLDRAPQLGEVAEAMGVSAATLSRRLREQGLRWRDLVNQRRMQAAARLLRQSRRDVSEIALSVGFAESASFIRRFGQHFGLTPQAYRRAAGEEVNAAQTPPSHH